MTLTEDNICDYADTLVLQARGQGVELDYSTGSISRLEDRIAQSDELLQGKDFPEPQRNLVVFYTGCYLGEVLARNHGGIWQFAENWFDSTLAFTLPEGGGLQLRPFQKVYQRITDGAADQSLIAYYEALREHLNAI
jgi:hypothetical protein